MHCAMHCEGEDIEKVWLYLHQAPVPVEVQEEPPQQVNHPPVVPHQSLSKLILKIDSQMYVVLLFF